MYHLKRKSLGAMQDTQFIYTIILESSFTSIRLINFIWLIKAANNSHLSRRHHLCWSTWMFSLHLWALFLHQWNLNDTEAVEAYLWLLLLMWYFCVNLKIQILQVTLQILLNYIKEEEKLSFNTCQSSILQENVICKIIYQCFVPW